MIALALLLAATVFADPHRARDFEAERLWTRKSVQILTLSLIPSYPLVPHSLKFGLVSATDSIRYDWTMPTKTVNGDTLHSWPIPSLWCLLQFTPPYPPRFDLRFRMWQGVGTKPGQPMSVTLPVYGFGSTWVEAWGPGGLSPRSNNVPSRLTP